MRIQTRGFSVAMVALGATLAFAGAAWACTASPSMRLSAPSGAPGESLTVRGGAFSGPVAVRWNSATGPVLGTAPDGKSFAVAVTIPVDAKPDVYYMVVTGAEGKSAETFEVTSPTGSPALARSASADAWSGFASPSSLSSPGLVDSAPPAAQTPASVLGVALLSVGLVALFSVFAVAEVRRRKARASRNIEL